MISEQEVKHSRSFPCVNGYKERVLVSLQIFP